MLGTRRAPKAHIGESSMPRAIGSSRMAAFVVMEGLAMPNAGPVMRRDDLRHCRHCSIAALLASVSYTRSILIDSMTTSFTGRSPRPVGTWPMRETTSMPEITSPNTE